MALVVDFDDFDERSHKLYRLRELKMLNPFFRATLFAVPGHCSDGFMAELPRWLEVAVHGWWHPDPMECVVWPKERLLELMDEPIVRKYFVNGFKAPGWQISDGCYEALAARDWWVADQHYNDHRRPGQLRVHCEGDGDHAHHHIQDWGSNGIDESWEVLADRVARATEFRFVSEAAR